MSKNLLLMGFKKAGDAGDETCRLQGTIPCTNPSSQHSKAYFQTLKNSQNLQYAPNCLEHGKCIKIDVKCPTIVFKCLHILDYIIMVDLKSKNLYMGTHKGQNT